MMNKTQLGIKFDVGAYCRSYRKQCGYTLQQFADKYGANYKTVSGFENGRSSSMYYVFMYMKLTDDNGSQLGFLQGVNDLVELNIRGYDHANEL